MVAMDGFKCSVLTTTILTTAFLLLISNTAESIDCYQFTWPGENHTDSRTDCDDISDANGFTIPCKMPFIYTTPSHLPPDIDDLNDHCSHTSCPQYKCHVENVNCIKYMWYAATGELTNYTSFCGTVSDITNLNALPVVQGVGCWTEQVGTALREVCVCGDGYCNGSSTIKGTLAFILLPLLALIFGMRMH